MPAFARVCWLDALHLRARLNSAAIDADLAELQHALPARAVINSVSWLDTASKLASIQDINTPFAVAFGIIALVLAVLITASVAAAAVVASYRRIGVLKSIGFTPAQIATTYLVQIGIPALAGALAGTLLGDRWVLPLLNGGPGAAAAVPLWINITVPLGLPALTGLAALVPALRAGRLSTVQTIVAAQTPRAGHGYAAHRFAGKLALPRPVSLGLAAPFTRPARSALTLGTVTFGLTAVVLAVGLDSSIAKIDSATTQILRAVLIGGGVPPHAHTLTSRQQRPIVATLGAQPGTLGDVDEADATASTPGIGPRVPVTAFQGNAAGLGWDITSGTWFTRPGQVVVNTAQPGTAHLAVGQTIHMTVDGKTLTARITGESTPRDHPRWSALCSPLQRRLIYRAQGSDVLGTTQARSALLAEVAMPTTFSFGLPGALVTVTVAPGSTGTGLSWERTILPRRVAHRPLRRIRSNRPPIDARPATLMPSPG